MGLREILGLNQEETPEVPEEEPQAQETPQPQYATVDQMAQMIESVTSRLQENLAGMVQQQRQPEATHTQAPQLQEPTMEEINEAFEEGDTKKALQLQAMRENVRDQRYQYQLQQLRQEGETWVSGVNNQLVDSKVPDYKRYQKEVTALMDSLNLPASARSNLQVVELLTNSIKGSKIDDLVNERIEAQKRQANDAATGDPSSNRNNQYSAPPPRVISEEAELALQFSGKSKEEFAKQRGHASWEEYEANADAYRAYTQRKTNYVPKWRRNLKK